MKPSTLTICRRSAGARRNPANRARPVSRPNPRSLRSRRRSGRTVPSNRFPSNRNRRPRRRPFLDWPDPNRDRPVNAGACAAGDGASVRCCAGIPTPQRSSGTRITPCGRRPASWSAGWPPNTASNLRRKWRRTCLASSCARTC